MRASTPAVKIAKHSASMDISMFMVGMAEATATAIARDSTFADTPSSWRDEEPMEPGECLTAGVLFVAPGCSISVM